MPPVREVGSKVSEPDGERRDERDARRTLGLVEDLAEGFAAMTVFADADASVVEVEQGEGSLLRAGVSKDGHEHRGRVLADLQNRGRERRRASGEVMGP